MTDGVAKGNNPELWDKLLLELDDKLQLGLLDKLRRVQAYHFEAETLILEAGSEDDESYLKKPATCTQLAVYAEAATGVREVKVKAKQG